MVKSEQGSGGRLMDAVPNLEFAHRADRLLATAIGYASVDDPKILKDRLLKYNVPRLGYTAEQTAAVVHAVNLIERVHDGQKRKHRKAPFLVHPLSVGLMSSELVLQGFLPRIAPERLIAALCHDMIEDGEIDGKPVTKKDILKNFQDINGIDHKLIAEDVHILSNIEVRNGERKELSLKEYAKKIARSYNPSELGVQPIDIKVADRFLTNVFDPSSGASDEALAKRSEKIDSSQETVIPILFPLGNTRVTKRIAEMAIELSKKTLAEEDPIDLLAWAEQQRQKAA